MGVAPTGNNMKAGCWLMMTVLLCLTLVSLSSCAAPASSSSSSTAGFINPMTHDVSLVTERNFDMKITRVRNSHGVAALLHFDSMDQSKYFVDVYNKVATELKGMATVSAIDCSQASDFCKKNMNPDLIFPLVVIYPSNPVPPRALPLSSTKEAIVKEILSSIPGSNVKALNSDKIDVFLAQNVAVPKVILFSSKDSIPVLFKALSNSFVDRVSFGSIAASETDIATKFKVTKRPSILMIRSDAKKPDVYSGDLSFLPLHDWINVRAETFVKGGGFSSKDAAEASPRPWLKEQVPQLNGPSHMDVCFKGSNMCAVYLSNGIPTEDVMTGLEKLSVVYSEEAGDRGAKFKWSWIDMSIEKGFHDVFKTDTESIPTFVIINPKKMRFEKLQPEQEANIEGMKNLLEKIISGDGRFTTIKNKKLPSFSTLPEIIKKEEL